MPVDPHASVRISAFKWVNRRHRREIGRPVARRCEASAVRRLGLSAAAVDG
jgi:hypothetical protein